MGRSRVDAFWAMALPALLGITGCSQEVRPTPTRIPAVTVRASAPDGVGLADLGRPCDSSFQLISGPRGRSLFASGPGSVREEPLHSFEHTAVTIDDSWELAASAAAWNFFEARASMGSSQRYATFRANQVEKVVQVDDSGRLRTPPPEAVWYVARIYYGHLYEVALKGDDQHFSADVRASFLGANGSIEDFKARNKLFMDARGRGMKPKDKMALFARTAPEIEASYVPSGEPVPVFVEYRSIPDVAPPPNRPVAWAERTPVLVSFERLYVYKDGTFGTSTWELRARCLINGNPVQMFKQLVFSSDKVTDKGPAGLPGPEGTPTFHPYPLSWRQEIKLLEGDTLECGVDGDELESKRPISASAFRYKLKGPVKSVESKFGTGNGDTEYWVFYRIDPAQ